ncbi:phenylacetate--CoA ligase family protein [Immundisolibacter sp.]|uniref:phenylacetate--CoA ligase family protein n=1 Tax=Immundisolibacter sp. TaxID=1934948 RepID=UPI0035645C38
MNEFLVRRLWLPLHERLRGRETLRHYSDLKASEVWDAPRLEALRLRKLCRLLAHCQTQVPYYRALFAQAGIKDAAASGAQALREFPPLERDTIRSGGDALLAESGHPPRLRANTGGSSGSPLVFQTDLVKEARHNAHKLRARSWFGVLPGQRQVDFWGSPIELSKQSRLRVFKDRYFLNQVLLSAFNLTAQRLDGYVTFLAKYRPRLVYGYPTVIYRVAQHVLERSAGLGRYRPRLVACTSEMLLEHQRETIRQVFDCPVANEYGSRDGGLIAHECPAGQLHIAAEHVWLEVDQPDADGVGDLLVTNLDGYGMPFVRYRLGDRGRLADAPCRCGLPLPVLAELQGRANDMLVGADGRQIHSLAPIYVLREIAQLQQFRLHQRADRSVSVELVLSRPLLAGARQDMVRRLQAVFGELPIELIERDTIPPEKSGKYRWVISDAV